MSDVVQAGYWPGSPTDTSYVFDQQLFKLWDSIQKECLGHLKAHLFGHWRMYQ